MKKLVNETKLTFLSCSANEGFARTAVSAFALQLDPTLDEMSDIKTAVSEAVTNCIVHAYPERLGSVAITAKIFDDHSIYISIKDKGVGIEDVEKAMEPQFTTSPGDERSGIGFSVMAAFMDSLRVKSVPGRGTTVTMTKRIRPRFAR